MNAAQTEAIATADAHTNDTGLPTYSELLAALRRANDETSCYFASPDAQAISMHVYDLLARWHLPQR